MLYLASDSSCLTSRGANYWQMLFNALFGIGQHPPYTHTHKHTHIHSLTHISHSLVGPSKYSQWATFSWHIKFIIIDCETKISILQCHFSQVLKLMRPLAVAICVFGLTYLCQRCRELMSNLLISLEIRSRLVGVGLTARLDNIQSLPWERKSMVGKRK